MIEGFLAGRGELFFKPVQRPVSLAGGNDPLGYGFHFRSVEPHYHGPFSGCYYVDVTFTVVAVREEFGADVRAEYIFKHCRCFLKLQI